MLNKTHLKFAQTGIVLLALMVGSCNSSNKSNPEEDSSAQVKDISDEDSDFVQIFDGKTLEGWEGDTTYWKVENGSLVGEVTPATPPLKHNTFIIWRGGQPADFELKADFRVTADGNTGINYRSIELDSIPFALKGYQADIDGKNRYTGQNYEERGRTTLAYRGQKVTINTQENPTELQDNIENNAWKGSTVTASLGSSDSLQTLIKSEDWNEIYLVVKGNRLQHYVNGVLMSDVTDNDTINRKLSGLLGLQVHVGGPMKVEYRNIRLKQL
ncbi:DUF1080 domain-containing protein [Pontibacter sp. 172403-2]|uniref:3-keto-disaccharide hydrolase n=1 Tax=Pontibacter rufus TaxID=2791028 RepID=UPI0018AFD05D|nr:DUF1080 domain-containing protein [Pontibacter sp. 172403-2]MBF9255090.1 DUF1080 domain-containing protein [Pontibacter sp. 172403-2]